MKKEQDKKTIHQRAYIDARYMSAGFPIPVHTDKEIFNYNDLVFTVFNGIEFWKIFEESGHTSIDFSFCKCKFDKE